MVHVMFFVGLALGMIIGYRAHIFQNNESPSVAYLNMKVAYNEAARLARRIHRQRLEIKRLKAQLPAVQKDPAKYERKKELAH